MDSVTTGNKKTITLSDETQRVIGTALFLRRSELEKTMRDLQSVGKSDEYFSEQLMQVEGAIKEFYAAQVEA